MKEELDNLYRKYNNRIYVHPDPLEFLYDYPQLRDREIVAMVASCLAYGRVKQILKSVSTVLNVMGPSPYDYLDSVSLEGLMETFRGFKHRFTKGSEIACLLYKIKSAIRGHGSLNNFFLSGYNAGYGSVFEASMIFLERLELQYKGNCCSLTPSHQGNSAFKRLNLFLRWMVRKDNVDPGGWQGILPSSLIIPLDIHMHRISLLLGLTRRKQADIKTALEVTRALGKYDISDPVKYDFSLTRIGMHGIRERFIEKYKYQTPGVS